MKKILIHIGTSKTGTTSIQNSFAQSRQSLRDAVYPYLDAPSHHFLTVLYQPFERLPRALRAKYKNSKGQEKTKALLRERYLEIIHKASCVILSSEFLCRFDKSEIAALKIDLDEAGFTEFEILVYFRPPASYFLSLLQQSLKGTHLPINPNLFRARYRAIISNYIDFFGPVVKPVLFDKAALYGGCVVQDFINRCENLFGFKLDQINSAIENQSLSCESLFILNEYRSRFHGHAHDCHTRESNRLLDILFECEKKIATNRLVLRPEIISLINRNHRGDAEWLYDNYGIDFRSHNENKDSPKHKNEYALDDIVMPPNFELLKAMQYEILHDHLSS